MSKGWPLRVLMVGSFTYRKGILDMLAVANRLQGRCEFRFVGDVPAEGQELKEQMAGLVEFVDRVPPQALAAQYEWGDVFFFPTIEDGFPAVLSQALAAGLPALTTPNGSGPDVIAEGVNGWCVPVRDVDAMTGRLVWLDEHREKLLECAAAASASAGERSWDAVANDFVMALRARWPELNR